MTTVALYARVSTKDKGQSTENQLPELRHFAQAHGYTVHQKYVEHELSGIGNATHAAIHKSITMMRRGL